MVGRGWRKRYWEIWMRWKQIGMNRLYKSILLKQLNNTVGHSLFARPSLRAGINTMPASAAQPPRSPFARPGSRAGSNTGLTGNIQGSSVNSELFP